MFLTSARISITFGIGVLFATAVFSEDWPEWRGANRDGISHEKGLPEKWSLDGSGLAWKAPYGGRSSPVVVGDHLYLLNTYTKDAIVQERLLCLNADTGKLLWEQRFNVFQSDVPMHRIAWAAPAADPSTGNVYAFGGGGTLLAFNKDGKKLWERSINQEFNLFTTHGGRTVSPVVDGDLVIIASASSSWGADAGRQHRFMAFDKRTGECMWISSPGGRPFDTTYSTPIIADVNGVRQLIAGSGDGGIHGMKAQTGEWLWSYTAAKRGINTGPVLIGGKYAVVTHSEENFDTNEMGLIAAVDATARGKLTAANLKWSVKGVQAGYSTPLADGDRLYQVDNGANIFAFDSIGGKQLWKLNLGSIQKASPVVGDGKIYIGTESGKFFILRPHQDRCETLSEVELPISNQGLASERVPEPVLAGAAVARGRVYFVSSDHLYAIGPKQARNVTPSAAAALPKGEGAPAWVQVTPTELTLAPGQKVQLHARLFDASGRFLREEKADWSATGIRGTFSDGAFTAAGDNTGQAGIIKATVGGISGTGRARIVPAFPWNETFESYPNDFVPPHWIGATAGKYQVVTLDGQKVMSKLPNETLFKRMRIFLGSPNSSNYTVECDVRAIEKRRQLGDVGIMAQTYSLVLFGNNQRLEMWPWQENTKRIEGVPFEWKPDAWYRLKLRVQNNADGTTLIQGKAWKTGDPEPEKWMVEKIDNTPNRQGSPGLFADAQFGAYFDNLKVTANQ
jgi:outer membrane protein assembly factor BamB